MSHCGQKLQCPSKCACGDEVRDEYEKAAQTPVKRAVAAVTAPLRPEPLVERVMSHLGLDTAGNAPQAAVTAPVADSSGSVGSKVIRKLLGRQIESSEGCA